MQYFFILRLIACAAWTIVYRLTGDPKRRREMLVTGLIFFSVGIFEPFSLGLSEPRLTL